MRAFYAFLIGIVMFCGMPRNAYAQLYVTLTGIGLVSEYDATTGKVINPKLITGLHVPRALALLGDTLFVSNYGNDTVGEYDAKTGAAINASFITRLTDPFGVAVKSAK